MCHSRRWRGLSRFDFAWRCRDSQHQLGQRKTGRTDSTPSGPFRRQPMASSQHPPQSARGIHFILVDSGWQTTTVHRWKAVHMKRPIRSVLRPSYSERRLQSAFPPPHPVPQYIQLLYTHTRTHTNDRSKLDVVAAAATFNIFIRPCSSNSFVHIV